MNSTLDSPASSPERSRMRFELIFASLVLAIGLFVLPAIIYGVGTVLLDSYGENQGLGAFYADFFRDLAEPSGRTWTLALGPLLLIYAVRALFIGAASPDRPEPPPTSPVPPPPARRAPKSPNPSRIEPRVGTE